MKDRKAVKLHAVDLVNEIRDFSRSYADVWRQIPWIAAEANGRDGFDQQLTRATVSGVWLVSAPTAIGRTHAYVDLLTGELIDTALFHRDCERSLITDVATLSFSLALDSIDAPAILHQLKRAADMSYADGVDPESARAWREHIRSSYNVGKVYDASALRCFD